MGSLLIYTDCKLFFYSALYHLLCSNVCTSLVVSFTGPICVASTTDASYVSLVNPLSRYMCLLNECTLEVVVLVIAE